MKKSFNTLREALSGKFYLISSFRYKNVVIFSDSSLSIMYGLFNNDGVAEYSRLVKVLLSPRLPEDHFKSMTVAQDGSLVVLSGETSIFMVRISADLWALRADGHVPHDQYICEVEEVHRALFDMIKPPMVLQVKWLPTDRDNASSYLLAVLFNDNRLRLYRADHVCDVPYATVDYSAFMCKSDQFCGHYGSSTYGFFKSIVAFDSIAQHDGSSVVVAIDSEGEMFSAVVSTSSTLSPPVRPLIPPASLPCDPIDLCVVDHPMRDLFSVFATVSANNILSFGIAVPDEHSGFSLFIHEQLQLPNGDWRLCDKSFESTVLIASESSVFYIELHPWLREYASTLSDSRFFDAPSPILTGSVVHELITTPITCDRELPTSIQLHRCLGVICKSANLHESTTMFIACSQCPPLATTFLKQKTADHLSRCEVPVSVKELCSPLNEDVLNAILSKKESLLPISMSTSQRQLMANLTNFIGFADKNLMVLRAALEMSGDRLSALLKLATHVTEKQHAVNQKLLQVFRQNVAIKERSEQFRSELIKTLSRVDNISTRLTDDRRLSSDEMRLLTKLRDCRTKMLTTSMKISKMSLEAAQLERESRGPARPFTASMGANLFVLQYGLYSDFHKIEDHGASLAQHEEELCRLKLRLENIDARFDELRSRYTSENKENINV